MYHSNKMLQFISRLSLKFLVERCLKINLYESVRQLADDLFLLDILYLSTYILKVRQSKLTIHLYSIYPHKTCLKQRFQSVLNVVKFEW